MASVRYVNLNQHAAFVTTAQGGIFIGLVFVIAAIAKPTSKGINVLNRDAAKKKRRGYTDPKSFVRLDGSEVLHSEDWKRRKKELWFRCGGQCEYRYPNGARCRGDCNDPHHVIPRWPKRDDRLENLMGACREHHNLMDERKIGGRESRKGSAISLPRKNRVLCDKTPNSTYGPNGSHMSCERRATMVIEGKNYCTQHGNKIKRKMEQQRDETVKMQP